MSRGRGRLAAALAAGVAVLAFAGPAYAQFCWKTGWNDTAAAKAVGSKAWLTADEWRTIIDEAIAEDAVCEEGAEILYAALDATPPDMLYMGPGTLAKGTYKSGNTPPQMGALPFPDAFAACMGDAH